MKTAKTYWEHFSHQADIGIRGVGSTKESAFEQAALALTAVITDPACVTAHAKVETSSDAVDDELLLIAWLSSLIYEMDTHKMLFSRFEVKINDHHLTAAMWGQKVDVKKHQPAVEVKGASYAALKVEQQMDGLWLAQCVVDV